MRLSLLALDIVNDKLILSLADKSVIFLNDIYDFGWLFSAWLFRKCPKDMHNMNQFLNRVIILARPDDISSRIVRQC